MLQSFKRIVCSRHFIRHNSDFSSYLPVTPVQTWKVKSCAERRNVSRQERLATKLGHDFLAAFLMQISSLMFPFLISLCTWCTCDTRDACKLRGIMDRDTLKIMLTRLISLRIHETTFSEFFHNIRVIYIRAFYAMIQLLGRTCSKDLYVLG